MNNIYFVLTTIKLLEVRGINTILFGGWAEEIAGAIKPREHKDIDLLYISKDFSKVDNFMRNCKEVREIEEKRFPHKRAFFFKGIMVELLLIEPKQKSYLTNFWDLYSLKWPTLLYQKFSFSEKEFINVVDPEIIKFYRSQQTTISLLRDKALNKKATAA